MTRRAFGPGLSGWLRLAWGLLVFLPAVLGESCILPFDIDDQASPSVAGGLVREPIVADIRVADQKLGLAGRLWLQLNGSCPATADELALALPAAKLVAVPGALPVQVYPRTFRAQVSAAEVADVAVEGVQLNITSASLPSKVAPTTAFTYPGQLLVASVVNGTATVTSAMLKNNKAPVPLSMGPGLTANTAGTFSFAGSGDLVQMQITKYNFTFRANFTAGPLKGPAVVWLAGNITSEVTLGCTTGCGINGKCVRSGASYVCACRCGFTGPGCSVPGDTTNCPDLPTYDSAGAPGAAPLPLADAEPPPVLSLGGAASAPSTGLPAISALPGIGALAAAPPAGTCSCAQGAGENTCPAGWMGANCDACVSDDVCKTQTGDSAATCHKGFDYTENTLHKAYVCDISNTILNGLLDPQRGYWINCTTAQTTNPMNKTGGQCEVGLRLKIDPNNAIICTASACQFRHGSSTVQCSDAQCACPDGQKGPDGKPVCPDIVGGYIGLIKGQDVEASCAGDVCTINISNFPIKLSTTCKAGDCVSTTNGVFKQGEVVQHRDYSAVIAAIPILVLAALSIFAGVYMMSLTGSLRRNDGKGDAGLYSSRAPAHPVHVLRWSNLTCTVPGSRFAGGVQHWGSGQAAQGPNRGLEHATTLSRDNLVGLSDGLELAQMKGAQNDYDYEHSTPRGMSGTEASGPSVKSSPGETSGKLVPVPRCRSPLLQGLLKRPERIHILKNAGGQAHIGELVGVLGPSGCGKTTMLSILAGSVSSLSSSSKIYGSITLDGHPRKGWTSRMVAYVPQFDFLLPTLTVAETLRYSALLRLPRGTSQDEVEARVGGTLQELGLQHVAGSQVGGSSGIRGVSGGERRRVTIGMELVIDPSIVVLDEPTSGLDSYTALNLMGTLKQVAGAGRIVMLSFHQPSPAMFDLLDRAFLMARGHVVFTGEPTAADAFFRAAGIPCPGHTAIAEHMLTCVSDPGIRDTLLAYALGVREQGSKNVDSSGMGGADPEKAVQGNREHPKKPQRTPFLRELAVLFWRTLVEIIRNPALLTMHAGMSTIMGLLCGGIFFQLKWDIAGAQGRLGAVFFSLVFMALTSLTTVDLLTNERGLVVKEVLGGYYRPFSYYLSKATLDGLLLRVLPAILFSIPLYPMTAFQGGAPHVALFFCVLAVFSATVGALSMAVTVGFGTAGRASLVMNLVLLLSMLFAGFLVNTASIAPALQWIHYLSVFFYGFESLTTNEISGTQFTFTAPAGGGQQAISMSGAAAGLGGGGNALSVDIKGDTFLAAIGINVDHLVRDVAILDAYFFLFVAGGIGLLYYTMPRALVVRPTPVPGSKRREQGGWRSMLRPSNSMASLED